MLTRAASNSATAGAIAGKEARRSLPWVNQFPIDRKCEMIWLTRAEASDQQNLAPFRRNALRQDVCKNSLRTAWRSGWRRARASRWRVRARPAPRRASPPPRRRRSPAGHVRRASEAASAAIPAQPSTIASAPSSRLARVRFPPTVSRAPRRPDRRAREPALRRRARARSAARGRISIEIGLDRRDRARQGGHDAEAMGDQRGQMKRRFADADDRAARAAARRLQPGVVEAGDDRGVDARRLALDDFLDHARRGEGLVEIAFDRRGPARRIDRDDLRSARPAAARAASPIRAVMPALVLGLTTRSFMRASRLSGVGAVARLPRAQNGDRAERDRDDQRTRRRSSRCRARRCPASSPSSSAPAAPSAACCVRPSPGWSARSRPRTA